MAPPTKKKRGRPRKKRPGDDTLTLKERLFAAEYIKNDGNGTKAAIAAGYSPNSADVIAAQNLRKHRIAERIADFVDQADIEAQEIIGNLVEITRASMTDLLTPAGTFDLNFIRAINLGHLVKAVSFSSKTGEITRLDLCDRLAAIDKLGKYKGLEKSLTTNINVFANADTERQVNFLFAVAKKRYQQAMNEGDQVSLEQVLDAAIAAEKEYQGKDVSHLKPVVLKRLADGSFGTSESGPGSDMVS